MAAAHVVLDLVTAAGIEVVIASHAGEVFAPATVVSKDEMLDVAVLRSDLGAAYLYEGGVRRGIDGASLLISTPPFPLRVGLTPVVGERGDFIGYRKERADGTGPLVFDTGKFGVREAPGQFDLLQTLLEKIHSPDLVAEGEVFEGHSGSPLVDDTGYVFAVVTSYDVPLKQTLDYYQDSEDLRRRRIRGTHMLFASMLLDDVPMTEEAQVVSRQLRNKGTVSRFDEALISATALNPLSWLTLTAEIMREPQAYLGALKSGKMVVLKIYQDSVKHCILSRADPWIDFLAEHQIDARCLSTTEFYGEFKRLQKSGASDAELRGILRPSIDAYRMELERNPDYGSFDVVELPAETRGRLHRELAELQLAALAAGDERVSVSDVTETMVAALADGGADPVALRTVASAAFLGQEYDLALASLALAHRAAPSQAFAEGVEQDFNQIARKHSVEQVGKIMAFDFREIAGDSPQRSDLADMVVLEAARMGAGTT